MNADAQWQRRLEEMGARYANATETMRARRVSNAGEREALPGEAPKEKAVTAPCETCKGTTVIDMGTGYQTIWQSCPDCQPKPEPVSDERLDELILLAENADGMWHDESSATALAGWRELKAARERISQLESDLSSARRTERRYLWLREHWDEPEVQKLHPWDDFSPDPDQLDEQIDAAMGDGK
jgi:hypothetical protein